MSGIPVQKKFKDLKKGDRLYFISPENKTIESLEVAELAYLKPRNPRYQKALSGLYKITVYIQDPVQTVVPEKDNPILVQNPVNYKRATRAIIVHGELALCLLPEKPPTVYSPSEQFLKEWISQ